MSRLIRLSAIGLVSVLTAGLAATTPATVSASSSGPASRPAPTAPGDDLYQPIPSFEPSGSRVRVSPVAFEAVRVDLAAVRSALSGAPDVGARTRLTFVVPTPEGDTEAFAVQRTQVMEARLAAAHPELATYSGRSLEDPTTTIALDVTPLGLHAAVRGPQGQRAWYVDPAYDRRGTVEHLSYYRSAQPRGEDDFVERQAPVIRRALTGSDLRTPARAVGGGPVTKRVYRLALTSDPSYADYFGTENVLAEKVTLINRVNQIYNDDLAITMQLVNATGRLNLDTRAKATGPNGPCGANPCFDPADPDDPDSFGQLDFCSGEALGRNRTVLGQLVGAGNYDIGHLALGLNGGGIAYLGVVGWDYKGGGCTGLPFPEGDFFAIDYVAHELGHQFAGNHTFNGVEGACSGGNRNARTSVEPGSGSSVMAYAGICGPDDLQPHTDPYFSAITLDEINAYTDNPTSTVIEVQTVSLRGFDARGETISIGFPGRRPVALTRGVNYTAAGVEAAIERLTGRNVTISGWGYDPFGDFVEYPAPLTPPDSAGFQVIFARTAAPTAPGVYADQPSLTVSSTSRGVSGFVGETAQGGPAENRGVSTDDAAGNRNPVVRAPAERTLPVRTPFTLTGAGRDADGDRLTYLWEQVDRGGIEGSGGTGLLENLKTDGPLFRVFGEAAEVSDEDTLLSPSPGLNLAGRTPSRTFPDLGQVLRGDTNAESGRCPRVAPGADVPPRVRDCFSEFLPTRAYVGRSTAGLPELHLRLTARDGVSFGGGVGFDEVTLRIDPATGPFLVTSQASGTSIPSGATRAVSWDVNRTDRLAERVRILLSTDGGRTWRFTLAGATPNDGTQQVRFPDVATTRARIMVAANDTYFFDVNNARFALTR